MWSHAACDDLFRQARTGTTGQGLVALGTFVTGRPCVVAQGGIALRCSGDSGTPVTDCAGTQLAVTGTLPGDVVLNALGVELVRTRIAELPRACLARRLAVGTLVWRAGLMVRMLDLAHAHLSGRESNGQKTLQHQLVKATFTECHALAERTRHEAPHGLDPALNWDLDALDQGLGHATAQAAKLMGAHGFLRGSLNSLECLSLTLSALMTPRQQARAHEAA